MKVTFDTDNGLKEVNTTIGWMLELFDSVVYYEPDQRYLIEWDWGAYVVIEPDAPHYTELYDLIEPFGKPDSWKVV